MGKVAPVRHADPMERCAQCGFVYEDVHPAEVPGILRARRADYGELLAEPGIGPVVTARPAPDIWSALEYACHVRDLLLVQRDRALLALVEDKPSFARMHRDERVALAGYHRQSIAEVLPQLQMAAELMAILCEGLSPAQLDRPCIYNFPATTDRDVRWLGRHAVHEVTHHLWDIRAVLKGIPPG
jgi:hypothetical protein